MTLQLTKKHDFDMVFDSQKVFRLVLDAISSPGKVVDIKETADKLFGRNRVLLTLAVTLLDNEVSFNACDNDSLTEDITSLTLAGWERVEAADFIFINDPDHMEYVIKNAKYGTLADPHKSATIIVQNDNEPVDRMILSGPGIDGQIEVSVSNTVKNAVLIRDAQNYEYPQGIDFLFISGAGELFAIPRLTRMEVR